MADPLDSKHSASPEGLPVETLGPERGGSPQTLAESRASAAASDDRGEESGIPSQPEGVLDAERLDPLVSPKLASQAADVPPESSCADSQQLEIPLEEGPDSFAGKPSRSGNGAEGDVEEGSCSSSEEDVEGLRKRQPWGSHPPAAAVDQGAAEQGSGDEAWLTLNKCVLGALALVCIGFLVFSGSLYDAEDAPLENLELRDLGERVKQSQVLDDLKDWMKQHVRDSPGDVGNLQAMSGLLDGLAKENQEIRLMQAQLQAQKDELEALLKKSEGERHSAGSQQQNLSEENLRLKESLLQEEMSHLSVRNELEMLKEKLRTPEGKGPESGTLMSETARLREELDAERRQIENYLTQKETLVAESQMLRQELDKQRTLVSSIRRDLDNLSGQMASSEIQVEPQQLGEVLIKWKKELASELQRSDTWESNYVQKREKRSKSENEKKRIHAESRGDLSNTSGSGFRASTLPGRELPKGPIHRDWKDPKKRRWEHGDAGQEEAWGKVRAEQGGKPWKDRAAGWPEQRGIKEAGHEHLEGVHHPRERDAGKEAANKPKKAEGPGNKESTHRHHDHNKFWKKLSSHKYGVPEGCTGVHDCARKEGLDLFDTELEPVEEQDFHQLLKNYLEKSNLSAYFSELTPLLSGFFQGGVFSHDQIRFRDFVDDVEDYLEDIARKESGDDDAVDDFEHYVFRHFFGDATLKRRSSKRNTYQRKDKTSWGGKMGLHPHTGSMPAKREGAGHQPASPEEQSDHHNQNSMQFGHRHPKGDWSDHHQKHTEPWHERERSSNHHHPKSKRDSNQEPHLSREEAYDDFTHKHGPRAEKDDHHEGRAKPHKNHKDPNRDFPLPEGSLDYRKHAHEFNHGHPAKTGRSGHHEPHKEFMDQQGSKRERGDLEKSEPFSTGQYRQGA
ncbi:pre-B-cell leukemia transcription factor-interacting protein 1 isoform X2 [Rhinatrema bivittatum]|uniref:pre-B-cell leukemia transcription factor-interacting protein 1 isoform X2 n=1 Tax=Rhinatrema bivittatum TaxID=194408 RepID=UPI00112D1983|nr:pre-B-cell leukemia transcription factor-interacting protein 1 isoform X2 [Rhinatrema bivittatum]